MHLAIDELIQYTDEERARWEQWFRENGPDLFRMPLAGDRETTVGSLILHIFGPELRYIQRIKGEPLTEYRGRPCRTVEEVFGFGIETRQALRRFIENASPGEWVRPVELVFPGVPPRKASVRKILFHALIHEIRHWAQLARIMRERGFAPPGGHDLLMSDALH